MTTIIDWPDFGAVLILHGSFSLLRNWPGVSLGYPSQRDLLLL